MIRKILSGGQTGVDRAALDLAIQLNIPHGGWCPKGRQAEDGPILPHYQLQETPSEQYEERTQWNVRDSDGTLVLVSEMPIKTGNGTLFTIQAAQQAKKPYLILELLQKPSMERCRDWIQDNHIHVLNIAGPRESQSPGIYQLAFHFLENFFYFYHNFRA